MTFMIETVEGYPLELKEIGIFPLKLEMNSPSPRIETEEIQGRDGQIHLGTTYSARSMRAQFYIESRDSVNFNWLRSEVFRLFDSKRTFHIRDKGNSKIRWEVRTAASYSIERLSRTVGTFVVDLISDYPYGESAGSTLNPFTLDSEYWQIGQGLPMEDLQYVHSTNSFNIFNAGDVEVDPVIVPLKIEFKGESENLKILNRTTNEEWQYNGSSSPNDVLTLDGIRSLKNGVSVFKDTNKKLLSIAKGLNSFEVEGAIGNFIISFDFRFYYI
ncbi:phage tail family protein [Bacillus sp. AG4(2022)]|uniref:phage tail family protein n=1 Tax=Bacillus sp. AG4(2022) TaxID=2962594 RepID=UPI002881DA68|nr:phage tail family protein [Bacillus sp. AG4(2022)]MDT0163816.1 phage tail family protein [Bacillus sp. AG4(2022)]